MIRAVAEGDSSLVAGILPLLSPRRRRVMLVGMVKVVAKFVTRFKPKRHWAQFSLTSLLVMVAVLCVPLAWLGGKLQTKRREREAIAAVRRMDGSAWYDYQLDQHGMTLHNASHPPGPAWIRALVGDDFFADIERVGVSNAGYNDVVTDDELNRLRAFTDLKWLYVHGPKVSDAGLAFLKDLAAIEEMSLHSHEVTGSGLENLQHAHNLRKLDLPNAKVMDSALEHLVGLKQLETLELSDAELSDAGLVHLKGLTKLKKLTLSGTNITDAGLRHLEGMVQLKQLQMGRTEVTRAGIGELQKALPNCTILWSR